MSTLAKLLVALALDSKEFNQGLGAAESKTAKFGQKLGAIGSKMVGVGTKLTAGLTLPLVGLGVAGVNAASDLEESLSKVNVVFGEGAAQVEAWSSSAATAFGLSRQQALEAAGTFGNLFTAMGMGQETSADMSMSLVELASDLASFNNIDPTVALEKLRAGLVGEVEPLRTLGVNLTADAVAAKALEMGLVAQGEELSASAKAQAAYALILEQTTNAQGDFARTSSGLANQARIAKAQLADAAAVLGNNLLPYVTKAVGFVNNLIDRFKELEPSTQKVIVIMGALAAAIGPLLVVLGSVIGAVGTIAGVLSGPVLLAIGAIVAAVALLVAAWTNDWGGIRTTLTEVWETTLKPALQAIWDWLSVNIPLAIQTVSDWWNNTLVPAMRAVWQFIQNNIIPLFQAVARLLTAVVGKALEALAGLWQNVLKPALETVWQFIQNNILPVLTAMAQVIEDVLSPVLDWFVTNILNPVIGALEGIGGVIQAIIGWINDLAAAIENIDLPDWLTPGSPTPFEMGLRGINEALKELANSTLPELTVGLRSAGLMQPAGAGAGAGGDTFVFHNHSGLAAALSRAWVEERRSARLNSRMGG